MEFSAKTNWMEAKKANFMFLKKVIRMEYE